MATAPRPGTSTVRKGMKITIRGRTLALNMADLGPRDTLEVRKATGFSLRPLLEAESFDADSLAVIWWLARRRDGEDTLTFEDVLEGFPSYGEINGNDEDILSLEVVEDAIDGDEDSPLP